jgi:tyrosyl-tRNA synthetase
VGRAEDLAKGLNILDLLLRTGLVPSKGEGRRLVQQGGIYADEAPVSSIDFVLNEAHFKNGELIIKKGKKTYHKIVLVK